MTTANGRPIAQADRADLLAELARLRADAVSIEAAMRQAREALAWYADEAMACDRHTGSGRHEAPQALLATVSVLALDAGRRANAAIEALHAAESAMAPTGEPK
jgi:hypothetical protein